MSKHMYTNSSEFIDEMLFYNLQDHVILSRIYLNILFSKSGDLRITPRKHQNQ